MMRALPRRWARRADFTAAVVAQGHRPEFAGWLGMSLAPDGDGVALIFDLDQLQALLDDYYRHDLWPSLADCARGEVHVVIADRSRARLARLIAIACARLGAHAHVVPDAGQRFHIDAPAAVVELFATHL